MVATVEDDRITKLRPDPDHPLSKGYACPKGIAMLDVQNDPDRVTHPLKKGPDGEFHRVSWDEALDDIGERLRELIKIEQGGDDAAGEREIRIVWLARVRRGIVWIRGRVVRDAEKRRQQTKRLARRDGIEAVD